MIGGRIQARKIEQSWDEILRLASSIRMGTVTASLILGKLASYPHQNGLAQALRELGRIERTLFTLDWIQNPDLRQGQQSASIREKRETRLLALFSSIAVALFEIAFARTSRTRPAD